LKGYLEIY